MKFSWLAFQNDIKDKWRKTVLTKPGHYISKSRVGWAALLPKSKPCCRSTAMLPLVCHKCRSQQWGTKKCHNCRKKAEGSGQSLVPVCSERCYAEMRMWRSSRYPFWGMSWSQLYFVARNAQGMKGSSESSVPKSSKNPSKGSQVFCQPCLSRKAEVLS